MKLVIGCKNKVLNLHCFTTLFTSWVHHWFTSFCYIVHLLGTPLIYIVLLPCTPPGYTTDLHCLTTLFTSWVHHWFTLFCYLVHLLGTPLIYIVLLPCSPPGYITDLHCLTTLFTSWVHHHWCSEGFVLLKFLIFCVVYLWLLFCLRPVFFMPNVASVCGLCILNWPFGFSYVYSDGNNSQLSCMFVFCMIVHLLKDLLWPWLSFFLIPIFNIKNTWQICYIRIFLI